MVFYVGKRDFWIGAAGIDSVERVCLGGVEQSILIQAENPKKPVLLFVHGGPCMPVPGVVNRGQDYAVATTTKELVKHFVLVFWDQRGAGKSYDKQIRPESIRVEQFFRDCNELIDILRSRFQQDKIYLAAHSWGTIIGLTITERYPEKLHGYIGISQILNWTDNDSLCYKWLKDKAKDANDKKTLKLLQEIGHPPYMKVKPWKDFRLPLLKHGSMIYNSDTVKHPGMLASFRLFLKSREYTLLDIFHSFYSSYNLTYTQELVEDFSKINLDTIKRIETPIAFLHGIHDFHVDGKPVEEFFQALEAPFGKEMVWYNKSSHMFHPEDAKKNEQYIINFSQN